MNKSTGYKNILKNFQYMKLMIASLINRFGDSVDAIASAWIIYELTSNAMWSAVLYGVNKLPSVLIMPLAGAWVEGKRKKTVMVVTDIIRAICVAFIATGYLLNFLEAWMLVITTFVISTAEAFRLPAGSAVTPKVLDKEDLSYGMSLSTALGTIVELIGMGIAAGIIAFIGTAGAIYIDMATFLLSAFLISTVKMRNDEPSDAKGNLSNYFSTLKQGFSYVLSSKVARFLVMFAAFLNGILVPLNSLQAPLASEVLGGGAEVLSVLGITVTVGSLIGTVAYPILSKFIGKEIFVISGGLAIGLYFISLIVAKPAYESVVFMYVFVAFISLMLGIFISLLSAFLQVEFIELIEEQYLARAASIMNAIGQAVTPIMSLVVSALAAFLPIGAIFVLAGIFDLVVCLYIIVSRTLTNTLKSEESLNAA